MAPREAVDSVVLQFAHAHGCLFVDLYVCVRVGRAETTIATVTYGSGEVRITLEDDGDGAVAEEW